MDRISPWASAVCPSAMVHNYRWIEASRSLYPGRNLHTSVAEDGAGQRSKVSGSPRPTPLPRPIGQTLPELRWRRPYRYKLIYLIAYTIRRAYYTGRGRLTSNGFLRGKGRRWSRKVWPACRQSRSLRARDRRRERVRGTRLSSCWKDYRACVLL